jgi:hypothetical protein
MRKADFLIMQLKGVFSGWQTAQYKCYSSVL